MDTSSSPMRVEMMSSHNGRGSRELTKPHIKGADQLSVARSSTTIDGWAMSAYQRDTVFRGSNLESPGPELDLRLSDLSNLIVPLARKPAGQEQPSSSPLSSADSDPFSDYLSYESDHGGAGHDTTEKDARSRRISKKTAIKSNQPQLQCTTTFADIPNTQPKRMQRVSEHSPLDALCRSLRTPADLPLSPSPLSLKPTQTASEYHHLQREGQSLDDARFGGVPVAVARGRRFAPSRVANPVPTSIVGVTPNFSLPAASHLDAMNYNAQETPGEQGLLRSACEWYRRSAPLISCLMAIMAAVCLTVCSQFSQTGATILARLPGQAFEGLGNNTKFVELYSSRVCLRQEGVSNPR